jgi:hypothetical protein
MCRVSVRWLLTMPNSIELTYVVSRDLSTEAVRIRTRSARLTCSADPCHPLDSHTVAHLECRVFGASTHLNNLADALMATDLAFLCREG